MSALISKISTARRIVFESTPVKLKFPLQDVTVSQVTETNSVNNPVLEDGFVAINQNQFQLKVSGLATYFATNGKEIQVAPEPGADPAHVNLYLQGSVFGAILHQRKILPLHGSSFSWQGKGICICGETLAGKSSLTTSFCLEGGGLLADDVTPIRMLDGQPIILPRSGRVKLWKDSMEALGLDTVNLETTGSGEPKYHQPLPQPGDKNTPLTHIIVLETGAVNHMIHETLSGVAAFTALRNQIYRWEYLPAMPETEAAYLQQLINISKTIPITKVSRPENIAIKETKNYFRSIIK